ncbi:MAG TPA: SDR family oxidoreductase [Candidatus Dormibacteraeota bacterium]|nr:SDR family oxidoreductase [Candidatus Dormibacteraeota bacterium]
MNAELRTVLVTGGGGYVGAVLVPKLLEQGYRVRVVDLFIFGEDVLPKHPALEAIKGDIRDRALLRRLLAGTDAVIHLACISNDPSFELNPELGKSINFDAFEPLVAIAKQAKVKRFVFASTSSVYGVSDQDNVAEDHPLVPLTDYSKYKALCEPILTRYQADDFTTLTIRPATLCGYSPRQRLDLTVNILTNLAVNNRKITIFGGTQKRPNLHLEDMTDLYVQLLELPKAMIAGKIFNAGYENHTVAELGRVAHDVVLREMPQLAPIEMTTTPSNDLRSYHISSGKIGRELGWKPTRAIEDAVVDLCRAFRAGKLRDSLTDIRYFNVKTVQAARLA